MRGGCWFWGDRVLGLGEGGGVFNVEFATSIGLANALNIYFHELATLEKNVVPFILIIIVA